MVLTTTSIGQEREAEDNGVKVGIDAEGKGYLIKTKKVAEAPVEDVKSEKTVEEIMEEKPKKTKKRSKK